MRTAETSLSIWAIEMASVPWAAESRRIAATARASLRGLGPLRLRWVALVFKFALLAELKVEGKAQRGFHLVELRGGYSAQPTDELFMAEAHQALDIYP